MVRIKNIKLIVYDFDGVMTNNKVYLNQNGNEMVQVNRADGLAVSEIKKLGIDQIIISTEQNPVVSTRANKLDLLCIHGVNNKAQALKDYCEDHQISLRDVAYVGNDINDFDAMEIVGITFCPKDAHKSIKAISNHILNTNGGNGVVRELYDFITMEDLENE